MPPKDSNPASPRKSLETLRSGKSIEQIYQKKSQLEHILLRPDTYVGSTEAQTQELWVFDSVQSRMVFRSVSYVPALYKIFDEILVNAADNYVRDPKGMDTLKVDINAKAGTISVWNNGKGLPVVIHKEEQMYVPEMVFGHLLTSDNYNDSDCKVVGGRNGYGAKLTNIFSQEFILETADGQKKYKNKWTKNMTQKGKEEIVNTKEKSYTCVTFKPDLAKFGMETLDDGIVSLMMKRVYDIAGSTDEKCSVWLNGEKLDVKNFKDYIDLYLLMRPGIPQIHEKCGERWEVCVSLTEAGFQQVSFVNSICTVRGGTHVTQVSDQIVEKILAQVKAQSKDKQKGGYDVKPQHVRNHIWIFVKCLIENPAFDSQTKETLTTKQSKFGSRCELSDKFMDQVVKSGVVDLILQAASAKSQVKLGKVLSAKTAGKVRLAGVPKLEDANDAGGKHSAQCTLILTEGDSAKALAVAGLEVVGRDRFGVFPLRGKLLNVRDATLKQMMNNEEIQSIVKILGLDFSKGQDYDSELKGLRYGSIMIMADQDLDGSHIKGLIINLIHAWWPSLAKMPGFIKEFFTPIVKVSKGKLQIPFYTMPEYLGWKESTENMSGWKIKYYKGLGTSTPKEAKEYFSQMDLHKMAYKHESEMDNQKIDLAFNKKRADDRKDWINAYEEGSLVDHTQAEVSYTDFIDKELVLFAKANVHRSIPSMVDGLKPSQRKVLFGCFKKKIKGDIKVAQLTGYVAEHAAYHHGEAALQETIVGLAQDFVGSNNLNLLWPQGQFGTRLQGGKDAASARYIFTRLSPWTRSIFKEADEKVLDYQDDEGLSIEPVWYCPVIPMVLVNGAEGIGTGWSTSVPNFNPRDIISNLKRYIDGKKLEEMTPWYQDFSGTISEVKDDGRCDVTGVVEIHSDSQVTVSELPVKKWTQDYREFLEDLLPKGEKTKSNGQRLLVDYTEHHTEKTVHFDLQLGPDFGNVTQKDCEKVLKLRSSIPLTNMMLFDADGKITKYESPLEIIKDFAKLRLQVYQKRKDYILAKLNRECEILSERARFIRLVLKGDIKVKKRKILDLIQDLQRHSFKPASEIKGPDGEDAAEEGEEDEADKNNGDDDSEEGEGEGEEAESAKRRKTTKQGVRNYEYLVGMPIITLTIEKVQELMKQRDQKLDQRDELKKKTTKQLWSEDILELEAALDDRDKQRKQEEKEERKKIEKARASAGFKTARRVAKVEEEKSKGPKRSASNVDKAAKRLKSS
mmetsp:Transcript_94572/g.149536  ORF Transcript_94572/g.149536 Transcript_94572/m.149536 type:complete len:1243 (-) Transcript_94572:166-3894(-)